MVSSLDDCSSCTHAWELEFGEPEIEIDNGCASYGLAELPGMRVRVGNTADGLMLRDAGSGWEEAGESFLEDGVLSLEWAHGE